MKNTFYKQEQNKDQDHWGAAVVKVAKVAIDVGKKIAEAAKKHRWGKVAKGVQYRKLAAGIEGLKALGYSVEQIRSYPLRYIVEMVGNEGGYTIANVANNGKDWVLKKMSESGITVNDIPPVGNESSYQIPADNPAYLTEIGREIFGPGLPEFGRPSADVAAYIMNNPPPDEFNYGNTGSLMSGITETGGVSASSTANDILSEVGKITKPQADVKVLEPLRPLMSKGLSDAGLVPPSNLETLAIMFYEKIVSPYSLGQSVNVLDNIDQSIVDSILNFVGSVANRQAQGESLPPVLEKIGDMTNKLSAKLEEKAVEKAQFKIGEFITENALIIGAVILVIIVLLIRRK